MVCDLLLYIQGKLRSFGGSVILTTLFLGKPPGGRLPVLSAHSFAIDNCFFFNQRERKNGCRNTFMKECARCGGQFRGQSLASQAALQPTELPFLVSIVVAGAQVS